MIKILLLLGAIFIAVPSHALSCRYLMRLDSGLDIFVPTRAYQASLDQAYADGRAQLADLESGSKKLSAEELARYQVKSNLVNLDVEQATKSYLNEVTNDLHRILMNNQTYVKPFFRAEPAVAKIFGVDDIHLLPDFLEHETLGKVSRDLIVKAYAGLPPWDQSSNWTADRLLALGYVQKLEVARRSLLEDMSAPAYLDPSKIDAYRADLTGNLEKFQKDRDSALGTPAGKNAGTYVTLYEDKLAKLTRYEKELTDLWAHEMKAWPFLTGLGFESLFQLVSTLQVDDIDSMTNSCCRSTCLDCPINRGYLFLNKSQAASNPLGKSKFPILNDSPSDSEPLLLFQLRRDFPEILKGRH